MEINHAKLDSVINPKKGFAPVYLVYGDELLYKEAFKKLLNAMVPPKQQGLNYDPLDGRDASASAVAASLATYPMFPGVKVTAWLDSKVFYSKKETLALLEKAKQAHAKPDMPKAARHVLDFLSMNKLELADLSSEDPVSSLKLSGENAAIAGKWLAETLNHCIKENLKVPEHSDEGEIIIQALEGDLGDNHLIITAELADKRKRLYKVIKEKGVVVDCSVPKGVRKADTDAQAAALRVQMDKILSRQGKAMDNPAFKALEERVGPDLRAFSNALEKLCLYVGDRKKITAKDVADSVVRTKQDPVFAFTGALAEKNAAQALVHLDRLIEGDFHPLAVLAASANALRKSLAVKIFLSGPMGNRWKKGMNFNSFKSSVMPAINGHDAELTSLLDSWKDQLVIESPSQDKGKKKKKAPKNKKFETDLLIAPKSRNPYPIYLAFKESDRFTQKELMDALQTLLEADRAIKSTPQNRARHIMEKAVFSICG